MPLSASIFKSMSSWNTRGVREVARPRDRCCGPDTRVLARIRIERRDKAERCVDLKPWQVRNGGACIEIRRPSRPVSKWATPSHTRTHLQACSECRLIVLDNWLRRGRTGRRRACRARTPLRDQLGCERPALGKRSQTEALANRQCALHGLSVRRRWEPVRGKLWRMAPHAQRSFWALKGWRMRYIRL